MVTTILYALFVAGVALASLVLGLKQIVDGARSRGWIRTTGRILAASVKPGSRDALLHRPDVRYRYETADGAAREGSRLAIGVRGALLAGQLEAGRIVSRFPVGGAVDVWYDPARPDRSVLQPGVHWPSSLLLVGFGVVVGLLSLNLWLVVTG